MKGQISVRTSNLRDAKEIDRPREFARAIHCLYARFDCIDRHGFPPACMTRHVLERCAPQRAGTAAGRA